MLSAIFEADFLNNSYGYRPGRSAKDAVNDLRFNLQFGKYGYIVEADIKGFFNHMDHEWLLKMLKLRINDAPFLNFIQKWLKAGILDTDGMVIHPETGTPQGGIVSPVLANVYLHFALDLWFEKIVKVHCDGDAMIIRYADDFVCAFQYRRDAVKFFDDMKKVFKEINRVAATDAILICSVPVPERNRLKSTIRGTLYSEKELEKICQENGFRFESIPVENGALLYFRAIL